MKMWYMWYMISEEICVVIADGTGMNFTEKTRNPGTEMEVKQVGRGKWERSW